MVVLEFSFRFLYFTFRKSLPLIARQIDLCLCCDDMIPSSQHGLYNFVYIDSEEYFILINTFGYVNQGKNESLGKQKLLFIGLRSHNWVFFP